MNDLVKAEIKYKLIHFTDKVVNDGLKSICPHTLNFNGPITILIRNVHVLKVKTK